MEFCKSCIHPPQISLSPIDVSACRKSIRKVAGDEMRISEHLRYDVVSGISISNKLVKVTRVVLSANVTETVPPDDFGVCSVRTQLQRDERRAHLLKEMQNQNQAMFRM